MQRSFDEAGQCADCGSTLQRGQSYCMACGARLASRSPMLVQLLRRGQHARAGGHAAQQSPPGNTDGAKAEHAGGVRGPGASLAGRVLSGLSSLRLPPAKISALLVLVFLGFGVLLGSQAGSPTDYTLAASARPHLKVIIPQVTSSSLSSSSGAEPPSAEAEPTPEPAVVTPNGSSGQASKGTSNGSQSTGATGSGATGSGATGSGGATGSAGAAGGSASGGSTSKLPPVKHVFVIMLSEQPYAAVFGPESSAPYLAQTLERKGELLVRYYAVAHEQLANEIALLSGQGPTVQTAANCPVYTAIAPTTVGAEQQVAGSGCVYPSSTQTLAGQLAAKHLTWRAYVEGIGESSTPACAHPALGAPDQTTAQAPVGSAYATFRDPFVYFQAVTASSACAAEVVGIGRLGPDLADAKHTPSFSYIVLDGCHDASPTPCASGAPTGPGAANGYLEQVIGKILGSKAYTEGGLLVVTVDEAPSTGEFADSSSCCGQPRFPNLPVVESRAGPPAKGGGQVGALLLSPFVKPATTSQEPYNHFSLLRSIEDLFGLKHLGYAASSGVSSFASSLYSAYTPR